MARFGDDIYLDVLLENRDSLSTKNVIKGSVSILQKYCDEKQLNFPESDISKHELNELLRKFYPAARTADGKLYSKKSMLSVRYGLQKHFIKVLDGTDIVNDTAFAASNNMFQAMLIKLKKDGKAKVVHKVPLSKQDLHKLYNSFDTESPYGLQNKVFVDFMIYFCSRGKENLREITKTDFIVDENNRFIEMRDMATKNHRGSNIGEEDGSQGGRIYKVMGHPTCPFASFMRYLSLLNPRCDAFFQRPKAKVTEGQPCYDNSALGENQLGDKMKKLSTEAELSRSYTNHCLRATSITLLDGYEARHVMTVSGHASESSIRSYARTSEDQREKMALTLSKAMSESNTDHIYFWHSCPYGTTPPES